MKKHLLYILPLSILFYACNEQQEENATEEVTSVHTVWTEKTELFVEYDAFVVGELSTFAAHFTDMSDFKAITEGKVTVSLIQGDKGIRNTVDAPSSPGIFKPALRPKTAGIYQLIFDIETPTIKDRIVIENVPVYASTKEALAKHPQEDEGNVITFLKEQAWKMDFANVAVKKQQIYDVIHSGGEILSAQGDERTITATASGIVMYSDKSLTVGASITSGTQLFTIAEGGMTNNNLEAEYLKAKSAYEKAKTTFERKQSLHDSKAISKTEFEDAQLAYQLAESEYNNLSRNFSRGGKTIRSNTGGFIKQLFKQEGAFVEAGEPLAIVTQNKNLTLLTHISPSDYPKLNPDITANFKTNNGSYSTEELGGKLLSYGKSVSAETPKIPVYFQIDNRGNLIPGSYIDVWIKTSPREKVLVIPVEALLEDAGKYSVVVQLGGESFEIRAIKTGVSDGKYIEVLSGLNEGERVVTKGAYQVKMASMSGQVPAHGHSH